MSNLVDHARRELELIGEEPEIIDGYLKVIQAFADMGHSGGSASIAIPTLNRLLQFQNLKPLTDDPSEWNQVDILGWQNNRNSEAFSTDGGKTYYLLSERKAGKKSYKVHISDTTVAKMMETIQSVAREL
jgi:hypothetical protein